MEHDRELVAFCEAEFPRLVGALGLLVDDVGVAEELAQEALLRVAERWERIRDFERPGGWVHHVAVNLARSRWRRQRAERRALRRAAPGPRAADHHDPDVAVQVAVRHALAGLPQAQREVLVLRHLLGCTTSETARLLGTSPAAVKSHAHRGRTALRTALGTDDALEATDG